MHFLFCTFNMDHISYAEMRSNVKELAEGTGEIRLMNLFSEYFLVAFGHMLIIFCNDIFTHYFLLVLI